MPTNTSWSSPLTAALPPPPGVIDYHGYAALICTFDDSTWIRMGRPSPMFVPSRFTSICRDYHSRIDRNRTAWCESQHLNPAKFTFPSYLYNPACYLTFGQTDSIGLVLIDDIDAMMEITADIRSPVEQVHLAYAPTLASLGLTSSPWFAELHEMFDAPPGQANGLEILPGNHQIQQTAPLLMWTKLKVNGVAMVGEGLLFQQAAYRAIAERILLVVSGLERHAGEPPQGPKQPLYSTADLDPQHLKFVFLDPQGVEEISVLIYTRNYSVGVSILAAIRCLTFANIFGADPRLKKQLSVSPTHQQIIAACRKGSGTAQASVEDLSDNHLLSKTYTTLGVAYQAFNKPESSGCTGFVLAYPQCDVNPGHLGEVEARLLDLLSPVAPTGTFTRQSPAAHVLGSGADIHRFLVGRHDYLLELHPQAANVPIQGLSVVGFFQLMRGLYERVGCVNARGEQETGLLDISTAIVVPFPRILLPDGEDFLLRKVGKRHLSLMPLLERIRHSVFGESTSGQSAPGTLLKAHQLSNALRELCLPSLLRRTIRYLYQDFAHCLSDPFLFEAVLDLFDIFFTLDHLFCEVLPQAQREDLEGRGERSLFTAGDLDELEGLLSALHNALTHRVAFCMPHSEVRDMAVDFRGGLNRLVAAADVPLKCGMGVLRRLIPAKVGTAAGKGPGTSTIPFNAPPRNTVGAVTRISFNPIPFLSSLSLGQKYGVWLGYIDMDVAHIINPLAYPMYVHEVSHLILRSLPTWPEWLKAAEEIVLKDRPSASEEREWTARVNLEEIAVEMLTYLFVFAPDFGLFQKYLIVRFNSYPAVSGVTTDKVLARFAEILLRIFFVTDPFVLAPSTDWNTCSELGLTYETTPQAAWERFLRMVGDIAPLFRDYASRFQRGAGKEVFDKYLPSIFDDQFPRYQQSISRLLAYVVRVYQRACKPAGAGMRLSVNSSRESLAALINTTIGQGIPFVRALYSDVRSSSDLSPAGGSTLDEFFVVNGILRVYIQQTLSTLSEGAAIHVPRPGPKHEIDLSHSCPQPHGWSSVLLDPLRPDLFGVNPHERAEKFRRQIAVMKTLWDISCTLRSRRLYDLLFDLNRSALKHEGQVPP